MMKLTEDEIRKKIKERGPVTQEEFARQREILCFVVHAGEK